jgi:hypothetical protein
MTAIAIGCGPVGTFNLLLGDTSVKNSQGSYERKKVHRLGNETFCTVLGSEEVLTGAWLLAQHNEPKQLDFLRPITVTACLEAALRIRLLHNGLGNQLVALQQTDLFTVSRSNAFCWLAPVHGTAFGPPLGPAHIPPAELWINYGGALHRFPWVPNTNDPFGEAIWRILILHANALPAMKIPLFAPNFAGAMVPHDPAAAYQWRNPFATLQDEWVAENPTSYGGCMLRNQAYNTAIPAPALKP